MTDRRHLRVLLPGLFAVLILVAGCRPRADRPTFTVVTGHDQIRQLGGGRDHTVVLLMGVGTLANSAITLARGERGSDCPVAIVEDGYGPNQRVTVGPLGTIAHQAAVRGIRSPAVVVVGDVVRLSPYAPAELAASAFTAPPAID